MSLSRCWSRSKNKSGEKKTLVTNSTRNLSCLHADSIISSLLSFPDYSPFSIACAFDRGLQKALAPASDDASVQDRLLDRTIQLASVLLESTKRCLRERAAAHNSSSWFLPPELTIKVFSKLDTKSLMQAAACCTLFNKCAMDRSSYAHIDLTTADNEVVCTMIHRAGKELRSLKLGHVTRRHGPAPAPIWFNGPFLSSLSYNHGFLWSRLRSLRLYNIRWMTCSSSFEVFSFCSNLTDLRIVGSRGIIFSSSQFSIYESIYDPVKKMSSDRAPVLSEPSPPRFSQACLMCNRDLGNSCKESPLETLIMRNCVKLEEKEVLELCNTLLKGNFKFIRHIDVSSNNGLVSDDGRRSYKPKFPVEKLKEERPDVTLVADFPLESCPLIGHLVKPTISSASGDDDTVQDRLIDRESLLLDQFLSGWQIKLNERRQKLEKRRVRSLNHKCTGSAEYTSLRYLESSSESSLGLEKRDRNIQYLKQEQEQPSHVSVLERIQKDSVHRFVKKVLEASRLNWTNIMASCNEETSLLNEFSHGDHNKGKLLLVLDYTDESLREIYRRDIIKFWPFLRVIINLPSSSFREDLIHETLRRFDWGLLCCDTPRTLDQIIETGVVKPSYLWSGFGGEAEGGSSQAQIASEKVKKARNA
ncbi:hypothetical protein Bca101_003290 [Brassica carinata]